MTDNLLKNILTNNQKTFSNIKAPESSAPKSEDDEVFVSRPQQYHGHHRDGGDTRSSVSRTSDGQRSYPSGSALPRKVQTKLMLKNYYYRSRT